MALTSWLDNPFRTIIEYAQMKAMRGMTVIDAFKELQTMMKDAPAENKVAEERIEKAIKYVEDKFGILMEDEDLNVQASIITALKIGLKED